MRLRNLIITSMMLGAAATAWADSTPKYIFYCIGDGMGHGAVMSANAYTRQVLGNPEGLTMTQFPVASLATTRSASSDVTDSAAAGTALSTGYKTRNSMLGMGPDTTAVISMAKMLFDDGWGIGLVTSVAIDDATPGAFYAHVPNRREYTTVDRQLAESGYQFAAGAGLSGARDKEGKDTGVLDIFAQNNVKVVYGIENVDTVCDRLLLLSHNIETPWSIGYAIDSVPGALTLPQMTAAGINHLQRTNPDRFFMMIEGGSIDHAEHGNDGGTAIIETIEFDKTLAQVFDFYKAHPDETLIVVTADHETGGVSLGNNFTGYAAYLDMLKSQKVSKEAFSDYCKGLLVSRMAYRWDDMEEYLRNNLGFWSVVKPTEQQTAELKNLFNEIFEKRNQISDQETLYANFNAFSTLVFKVLNNCSGIGWTSTKHTGNPVPVFAVGVGAERFSSMKDNTGIPRTIMEIAGKTMN